MSITEYALELKNKFEKLLIWFIPLFFLSQISSFLSIKTVAMLANNMQNLRSPIENYENAILIFGIFKFLDNIVVGIWLFFQTKKISFNKLLWPIFGFMQPYFAILIFMSIIIVKTWSDNTIKSNNTQKN
jgi:hypothetical protein